MQDATIVKLQKTKDKINLYRGVFGSDDGLKVLSEMKRVFDGPSYVPRKNMTFDEVAFNEGVKYFVRWIEGTLSHKQIEKLNKMIEENNE